MQAIGLGGALATLFGFVDDVVHINAVTKLLTQGALGGLGPALFWRRPLFDLPWMPAPVELGISWFALVWLMNAYNFMDGVDGMAASGAVFICAATIIVLLLARWRPRPRAPVRAARALLLGLPAVQLAAGIHLHGGFRKPVSRILLRRLDHQNHYRGRDHPLDLAGHFRLLRRAIRPRLPSRASSSPGTGMERTAAMPTRILPASGAITGRSRSGCCSITCSGCCRWPSCRCWRLRPVRLPPHWRWARSCSGRCATAPGCRAPDREHCALDRRFHACGSRNPRSTDVLGSARNPSPAPEPCRLDVRK